MFFNLKDYFDYCAAQYSTPELPNMGTSFSRLAFDISCDYYNSTNPQSRSAIIANPTNQDWNLVEGFPVKTGTPLADAIMPEGDDDNTTIHVQLEFPVGTERNRNYYPANTLQFFQDDTLPSHVELDIQQCSDSFADLIDGFAELLTYDDTFAVPSASLPSIIAPATLVKARDLFVEGKVIGNFTDETIIFNEQSYFRTCQTEQGNSAYLTGLEFDSKAQVLWVNYRYNQLNYVFRYPEDIGKLSPSCIDAPNAPVPADPNPTGDPDNTDDPFGINLPGANLGYIEGILLMASGLAATEKIVEAIDIAAAMYSELTKTSVASCINAGIEVVSRPSFGYSLEHLSSDELSGIINSSNLYPYYQDTDLLLTDAILSVVYTSWYQSEASNDSDLLSVVNTVTEERYQLNDYAVAMASLSTFFPSLNMCAATLYRVFPTSANTLAKAIYDAWQDIIDLPTTLATALRGCTNESGATAFSEEDIIHAVQYAYGLENLLEYTGALQRLVVDDETIDVNIVSNLSCSGDWAVLSDGSARAYLFRNRDGQWQSQQVITSLRTQATGGYRHLALSNDTLVVGYAGLSKTDSGFIQRYIYSGESWQLQQLIEPDTGEQKFGEFVAIHQQELLCKSQRFNSEWDGNAPVIVSIELSEDLWTETQEVFTSMQWDYVAVHGQWFVSIGTRYETKFLDPDIWYRIRFFEKADHQWLEKQVFPLDVVLATGSWGCALAITDRWAFIGHCDVNGEGTVYIFKLTTGGWEQTQILGPFTGERSSLGRTICAEGDYCVIQAPGGSDRPSACYLYQLVDDRWVEKYRFQSLAPHASDKFGESIGITNGYAFFSSSSPHYVSTPYVVNLSRLNQLTPGGTD